MLQQSFDQHSSLLLPHLGAGDLQSAESGSGLEAVDKVLAVSHSELEQTPLKVHATILNPVET